MVASPTYPCQLVFVAKLTAVLNDESGDTAPSPCGLRGSTCCRRCNAYTAMKPSRFTSSTPNA